MVTLFVFEEIGVGAIDLSMMPFMGEIMFARWTSIKRMYNRFTVETFGD